MLRGKRILITGGTGSLGRALVRRLLSGQAGDIESVTVFSRDEAKQHDMRLAHPHPQLKFIIGDVRDYWSLSLAMKHIDIVIHAAALKHVSTCERFPDQALLTNCNGAINIVRAIRDQQTEVDVVVGVSSDKGCEPVNCYGATKLLQEKILLQANADCPFTRFCCVCYGNVLASRGSVIPVFQQQIADGGPVTVTDPDMTRFMITLDQAVDTILAVLETGKRGEVYVPRDLPATRVGDMASVLINGRPIEIQMIGKRTGEKMHEVLVTELEAARTVVRDGYYVVTPELQSAQALSKQYISRDYVISKEKLTELFRRYGLLKDT